MDLHGSSKHFHKRISALAFADDTAWIGATLSQLQRTINISNEFFNINDIDINGKKSHLLAINHRNSQDAAHPATVVMGNKQLAMVTACSPKQPVRYLGV